MRALEAGKHVLCEKPFSRHSVPRSRRRLRRWRSARARRSPRRSCSATTRRPARLASLVAERRDRRAPPRSLGVQLLALRRRRTSGCGRTLEGGSLMDVGCYCVSGSRLLAGEPESVYRDGLVRRDAGPTGSSRRRCASRATCSPSSTAARRCPTRDELEAIGSDGSLFLDDPWHCRPAGHRGPARRRGRANRARPGRLLPSRARERQRRDPWRSRAAPRPRGCGRAGAGLEGCTLRPSPDGRRPSAGSGRRRVRRCSRGQRPRPETAPRRRPIRTGMRTARSRRRRRGVMRQARSSPSFRP